MDKIKLSTGQRHGKTKRAIDAANEAAENGQVSVFVNSSSAASKNLIEALHPDVHIISCFSPSPIWYGAVVSGSVTVIHPDAWGVETTRENLIRMCKEGEQRGALVIRGNDGEENE